MRYLIKQTQAQADAFSSEEAKMRGCGSGTTHWYAVRETSSGQWCVMIDDDKDFAGSTNSAPVFKEETE